jgi:hypothetical protein
VVARPDTGMTFDPVAYSRQIEDALGVPPLVRVRDKGPFERGWSKEPRRDPERWRHKLEGWTGNLGILTGHGLVAVDVDLYVDGAEDSWDALRDRGFTAYTPTNLTGGGGRHYLYEAPAELVIPSRQLRGFPGVQVKSASGCCVVPPSIHPLSGKEYEWEFGWSPFDVPRVQLTEPQLLLLGADVEAEREERELDERDHQAVELLLQHFDGHSPNVRAQTIEVTRPGKESGCSAEIGFLGPGVTKVWSSSWPGLPEDVYELWKLRKLAGVPPREWNIPPRQSGAEPTYIVSSAVRTSRQHWMWEDFLPCGQLVLGSGSKGLGKSTAFVWIAARLTRGDLPGDYEGEPGSVVFISAEDDADHILKPRATAAGADHNRLYYLNPRAEGESVVMAELVKIAPLLVVLDPMSVFLELTSSNEHGEIALRKALAPFARFAQDHNVTVAGIRHPRKGHSGDDPFDSVLGSRAWSAAPRALVFFTKDPREPDRSGGLVFPRGNLASGGDGRRYRLDPIMVATDDGENTEVPLFVLEEGGAGISLEDALGPREQVGTREDAKEFLRDVLADGAVAEKDVQEKAKAEEFSPRTLRRAKKELGVISERRGFGPGSVVYWRLPAIDDP